MPAVPVDVSSAVYAPTTRVVRRAEIYEADATTLFMRAPAITEGNISVDMGRAERRVFDLTLDNRDGSLDYYPEGLWYDKIIKIYRGVETADGSWEMQLGEFMIDGHKQPHFPKVIQLSGRDYAKKLILSKFIRPTLIRAGQAIETVIKNTALNAGITKFLFPVAGRSSGTGQMLDVDYLFEGGTSRWDVVNKIALAFNYELFFDMQGYFVMRKQRDPLLSPLSFTLRTGWTGTQPALVTYEKSSNDSRIFNHIVVKGEKADRTPVFGEALNTQPDSPTRIARIGDRVDEYPSAFVTNTAQARDLAKQLLSIAALESFDLNFSSLVIFWLEAGEIVSFEDPWPAPGDPTRFLLTNFSIPLALGPMSGNAKRVTVVG